jgi:antitoxin MazE
MQTTIQKWGNSQGLRLPQALLTEAGLKTGDAVQILIRNKNIVIRNANKQYPTLKELVAKIPKNYKKHKHEDLFGKPMGKEVW